MQPYTINLTPAALDADGLAAANSSAGASVTLDGALTSGGTFTSSDGLGRRIVITDTATLDQSSATFTVIGTDSDGLVLSEAITGPGSTLTVTSTKYFLTVTSVTIANPVATATVNIGTNQEVSSKTLPLNYRAHEAATHAIDITGTINFDIEESQENIHATTPSSVSWFKADSLTGKSADIKTLGEVHATACRFVTNTFTAGVTVKWVVFQNED